MQESKKSWKHKIYSGREQEQALEFVLRPLPVLIASDLEWQPTLVLLLGKFHGWRSLVGYSPGVAKSRTRLSDFTFLYIRFQCS